MFKWKVFHMNRIKIKTLLFTPCSATRCAMHRIYAVRINSRDMSRVFCDLRSQKTPRGILPVNSNIKTLHFHPNQHRTKRPTGFIRPTATTRYSNPTTKKRETAWDKNRIIQTIKKAENLNKIKAFCPFLCMREMGLEPTRAYTHKILSLACLPIPALPHSHIIIPINGENVNMFCNFYYWFFR